MGKIAILFGVLLIALGVGGFVGTGSEHKTALIPAYFGAAIAVCGVIALNPSARQHAMHVAAMVGTIGLLGSVAMVGIGAVKAARTGELARPIAFLCQVIMLVLTAIFVGLCVKSFIDVRRSRSLDQ